MFVRYAATIADTDPKSALASLERALPIDPANVTLLRQSSQQAVRAGPF